MSLPEVLLWGQLTQGDLARYHFRKQHPIGPYVLDFYCHELRLAIEVDGESHNMGDRDIRDIERDAWMAKRGIKTLRIPARSVLGSMSEVIWAILAEARG